MRRKSRRRLETQTAARRRSWRASGILAGGIAHDFNNLLSVILGNETLATSEAQAGSRLAKQLDRIRSAAKHAEALTNQMLTYSGKASVSLEPLDLSELVEEMRELLEASTSKKCRLEISLDRTTAHHGRGRPHAASSGDHEPRHQRLGVPPGSPRTRHGDSHWPRPASMRNTWRAASEGAGLAAGELRLPAR